MILQHRWEELYDEVKAMKAACGPKIHMKSILAIGELGNMANVYKASLVCMMAGSDFIKTSTGKESINAILPVGLVMCRLVNQTLLQYFLFLSINFQSDPRILRANGICGRVQAGWRDS